MKRYYLLLTLSILSFPLRAAESISNCDEGLPHTSTGFLGETDERIPLPPHLKNKWWEVLEGTDICALKEMLTQFSIDPNEENKDGRTPLHIAAAKGHTDMCALLVNHGANVEVNSKNEWKIVLSSKKRSRRGWAKYLYISALWDQEEGRSHLLNKARNDSTRLSRFYSRVLYLEACCTSDASSFFARRAKAFINEGDERTWHPLFIAAREGHIETCKFLLESMNLDGYQKNECRWALLYMAVREGHIQICKYLLESTDFAITQGNKCGWTPLYIAAENGHTAICKYLIEELKLDVNQPIYGGYTPLYGAARNDHKETCELLISNNADINQASKKVLFPQVDVYPDPGEKHGYTPLRIAAELGHKDTYDYLIDAGANKRRNFLWFFKKKIHFEPKREKRSFFSKIKNFLGKKSTQEQQPLLSTNTKM